MNENDLLDNYSLDNETLLNPESKVKLEKSAKFALIAGIITLSPNAIILLFIVFGLDNEIEFIVGLSFFSIICTIVPGVLSILYSRNIKKAIAQKDGVLLANAFSSLNWLILFLSIFVLGCVLLLILGLMAISGFSI